MKKIVTLLLVGIMAMSLISCNSKPASTKTPSGGNSSASTPAPQAGGEVSFGVSSEVNTAASWRLRSNQEQAEWSAVYEPLFRMDGAGNVTPFLAKAITPDPEKLTYTIELRDDVTFSDGSALNADVLLWNFENFKANSQTSATHFGDVKGFEKVNDSTVIIHMNEWSSQIPYSLTNVPGLMYSQKAFTDNSAEWAEANPVGTGPYVLSSWVKDDVKVFTKNPTYWKKDATASLEKITFKVVADEMSAQAALISGDLDGYLNGSYDMVNTLSKQGFKGDMSSANYRIIFLIFGSDIKGDPLTDVRVRQAIGYAIDSEAIVKNLDYGITWNSNQYAIKDTIFWNDDVKGYGYDPAKAKTLLADAGYPNGFKTKISVGVDQALDRYMIAVQGYLAEVGIEVELDYQETAVWTSTGIYETDGGMILAGHGFGYNLVNQMASNFSKRAIAGVGMLKNSKIHPDDLDTAIMNALRAKDTDTMLKYAKEAQKLIIDEYCLGYPVVMGASSNFIHSDKIVDEGCFTGGDSYPNWNLIHRAA